MAPKKLVFVYVWWEEINFCLGHRHLYENVFVPSSKEPRSSCSVSRKVMVFIMYFLLQNKIIMILTSQISFITDHHLSSCKQPNAYLHLEYLSSFPLRTNFRLSLLTLNFQRYSLSQSLSILLLSYSPFLASYTCCK